MNIDGSKDKMLIRYNELLEYDQEVVEEFEKYTILVTKKRLRAVKTIIWDNTG